jgi:hypothetical protein
MAFFTTKECATAVYRAFFLKGQPKDRERTNAQDLNTQAKEEVKIK